MKPLEWVAIVGAAAWIPQVLGWVVRKLAVPSLRLVPSNAPEIGYTSFGPIFNLTCAISAEKKDAIIERITCTLKHERGQTLSLRWTTLNETFSQVTGPQGMSEVSKSQSAIALKVGTLVLAEKRIGFNDLMFQQEVQKSASVVFEKLVFLRTNGTAEPERVTLASREFADLIALWDRHFPWQEGRYTAHTVINVVGVKKATVRVLHFTLSRSEIRSLRGNLAEIGRFQTDLIRTPAQPPTYAWNWVYPSFEEAASE